FFKQKTAYEILIVTGVQRVLFRSSRIINNLDPRLDLSDAKAVKSSIEEMFNKFIDEEGIVVTRVERQRMLEQIMDKILGFGPIRSEERRVGKEWRDQIGKEE